MVSREIWVISDTHFNHRNILSFKDRKGDFIRPFSSVEEMDETMIENWNQVIQPQDKVYHLGDVYFGSRERAEEILSKLQGHKRLIVGNHDVIYGNEKGNPLLKYFEKIYLWRMWPDFRLLLSHVPVHESTLGENRFSNGPFINIHGHTHQNGSPTGPYKSVCVELIDYKPVNIEELRVK